MDDSNMLNDESLDKLGYIKELDIFSIVDKQFDKKRERKRVKRAIFISILIVVFVSLITCLAIIMPRIAVMNIPKLIIGYYFVSVSMVMLLIIPIIKRKKSY